MTERRLPWSHVAGLAPALLGLAALGGCRDITNFSTAPGEAYCGSIVSACFVRFGFSDSVKMRLTFDADQPRSPGALWTNDPGRPLLDGAQLRPIPELMNDPLSTLSFGEGRDRNLMYAVEPSDGDTTPILAVLSLMRDGDAEVRLIRGFRDPAKTGGCSADGSTLFGVFSPLKKQPVEQCGF